MGNCTPQTHKPGAPLWQRVDMSKPESTKNPIVPTTFSNFVNICRTHLWNFYAIQSSEHSSLNIPIAFFEGPFQATPSIFGLILNRGLNANRWICDGHDRETNEWPYCRCPCPNVMIMIYWFFLSFDHSVLFSYCPKIIHPICFCISELTRI